MAWAPPLRASAGSPMEAINAAYGHWPSPWLAPITSLTFKEGEGQEQTAEAWGDGRGDWTGGHDRDGEDGNGWSLKGGKWSSSSGLLSFLLPLPLLLYMGRAYPQSARRVSFPLFFTQDFGAN